MRSSIYVLVALAAAAFANASAQSTGRTGAQGARNTGNPATTPGTQTPLNSTARQTQPNTATAQQTVRPPDSRRTTDDANTRTNNSLNNPARQNRVPPAMRGVGTTGRPDCSKLRGIEKAECERRDTVRDDLPAGVTTTQPKSPQQ